MSSVAKVIGWTIGGAVAVKLLTSSNFAQVITNAGSAWSGILSSITGGGTAA